MDGQEARFVPVNRTGRYDCDLKVLKYGRILLEAGTGFSGVGREDEFLFLLGCDLDVESCPTEVDGVVIIKIYRSKNEYELVKPDRYVMNYQEVIDFLTTRKALVRI